jgi:hypothetical protein
MNRFCLVRRVRQKVKWPGLWFGLEPGQELLSVGWQGDSPPREEAFNKDTCKHVLSRESSRSHTEVNHIQG